MRMQRQHRKETSQKALQSAERWEARPTTIYVAGTKSMTGHLLGGAGAIESIYSILAIRDRKAPPTANLDNLDPEVTLNVGNNGQSNYPRVTLQSLITHSALVATTSP